MGHPGATLFKPQQLSSHEDSAGSYGTCQGGWRLLHNEQDYQSSVPGSAGAPAFDAGENPSGIDWTNQAVLVDTRLSNTAIAQMGLEGSAIIVLENALCQGMKPRCMVTLYVVPNATSATGLTCPTNERCLAP
jgi:hypothetical protein